MWCCLMGGLGVIVWCSVCWIRCLGVFGLGVFAVCGRRARAEDIWIEGVFAGTWSIWFFAVVREGCLGTECCVETLGVGLDCCREVEFGACALESGLLLVGVSKCPCLVLPRLGRMDV